jgi:hypothetical protein
MRKTGSETNSLIGAYPDFQYQLTHFAVSAAAKSWNCAGVMSVKPTRMRIGFVGQVRARARTGQGEQRGSEQAALQWQRQRLSCSPA